MGSASTLAVAPSLITDRRYYLAIDALDIAKPRHYACIHMGMSNRLRLMLFSELAILVDYRSYFSYIHCILLFFMTNFEDQALTCMHLRQ